MLVSRQMFDAAVQMSNVLFNAKQDENIDPRYRRHFAEVQIKWDLAKQNFNVEQDEKKKKRTRRKK